MSKPTRPSPSEATRAELPPRPRHGHQSSDAGLVAVRRQGGDASDPHPAWLKKWRTLRTELGGVRGSESAAQSVRDLQEWIAHTPAGTLAGLQAQAELISELAWNDAVAATARQLIAGIKRLRRSRSE
ncbi:MAG: hypothetical protein OEU92_10740 [Alphaproteobacteria bacterium]|nr:hypothetical protein [Alphaproteobacteria bacterium]